MNMLTPRHMLFKAVVVLGTDDVASAVGCALHKTGVRVLLVRDSLFPVLRREMAFDDALERGGMALNGVRARAARDPLEIEHVWRSDGAVIAVTALALDALALDDLLCIDAIAGIVDARMRRRSRKTDLRPFAPLAVGLGPGFEAGHNVHVAIETAPEATGRILYTGATLPAHGRSAELGGAGRERFGRAPCDGLWRTPRAIGDGVGKDELIGFCGEMPVFAPLRGRLRGLVRDRSAVATAMRLLEIDPRGEAAQYRGIPPRAASIAAAVRVVVTEHLFTIAGGLA